MKSFIFLLSIAFTLTAFGQNKEEIALLAKSRSLHNAVFVKKDSVTLQTLFSDKLSYGHSGGKLENKAEAISGIIHNQSVYAEINLSAATVWMQDKTAIVRQTMAAMATDKNGIVAPLKIQIMLVWIKEKGEWKLLGRQAVKLL